MEAEFRASERERETVTAVARRGKRAADELERRRGEMNAEIINPAAEIGLG